MHFSITYINLHNELLPPDYGVPFAILSEGGQGKDRQPRDRHPWALPPPSPPITIGSLTAIALVITLP